MRGRTILLSGQTQVSTSVSSGGTTNKVAKFTGAYTIGDSTLTDDGTNVSATGYITATGFAAGPGSPVVDSATYFAGQRLNNGVISGYLANSSTGVATQASWLLSNAGNAAADALVLRTNGTGFSNSGLQLQDGTSILSGANLSGQMSIGTVAAAALVFATTNTARLTIDAAGNALLAAAAVGTSGVAVLCIGNSTVPSTSPADMIQIFSVDAAAGSATLGLRTEAVVVTETVVSDRTLQVVINGTVYKFCLKV